MPRILRALALVLLALIVPAQGMAAVIAGQCMAFGHHQDAGHVHDEGAGEHHHPAQDGGDDAKSAHCGPCTACCASASITGPIGLSFLPASSDTDYFFSQAAPPAVQPHRLDRPPLAL